MGELEGGGGASRDVSPMAAAAAGDEAALGDLYDLHAAAMLGVAVRILEPGRWDLCTLFDVNYEPRGMSADELRAGLRSLSARLYTAEAIRRRRE